MYREYNDKCSKKSIYKRKIPIRNFLFFCMLLIILVFFPNHSESIYKLNYLFNSIFLVFIIMMLLILNSKRRLDIFEPIIFFSIIYLSLYFITPIIDLIFGQYYWYGYNLFHFGIKGSAIAFLGYIAFFLGYNTNFRIINNNYSYTLSKLNDKYIVRLFIIIMYFICIVLTIYYISLTRGVTLSYILTLGFIGENVINSKSSQSLGFLSMFSYALPAISLLNYEYGKNKLIKFIMFYLMFITQVVMGYRFILIQAVITFISYYYLKSNKRPKFSKIVILLLILIIPLLIMTIFRDSIRGGRGIDSSILSIDILFESLNNTFLDNLRIYNNFYGMIEVIPSKYSFVYLKQILIGTIIMFIPRSLFPNKLSSYGGENLRTLIGQNIASGQAYPNLGEYYYSFGIIGVVFFMFIYGFWLISIKKKYMSNKRNDLDRMIYCLLLGVNLQLIIRGYTPSNFYLIVFTILPIYIFKLAFKKISKKIE